MLPDLALDPSQRLFVRAVGRKFEHDVRALAVARPQRMQARKMRSVFAIFVLIQGGADIVAGRIPQGSDGDFSVRDTVRIERRYDSNKCMAHDTHRSKRSVRWAGNGPAHCTASIDLIPRRTSPATSAGI